MSKPNPDAELRRRTQPTVENGNAPPPDAQLEPAHKLATAADLTGSEAETAKKRA
jgi:hypothetical protein